MKKLDSHHIWGIIFLIMILSSCGKPLSEVTFLRGKTHQLRIGKPKHNVDVVKVIKKDVDERGLISVVFIQRKDTVALDHLTTKQFNKIFKFINN